MTLKQMLAKKITTEEIIDYYLSQLLQRFKDEGIVISELAIKKLVIEYLNTYIK